MPAGSLMSLVGTDGQGRPCFGIVENPYGELVLDTLDGRTNEGYRPLEGVERMRLAALAPERPSLVVENTEGDYVVLVESPPDLDRHSPLTLDDAEVLAGAVPSVGLFGRREDDVLELTAWVDEDAIVVFDPDQAEFADVPLAAVAGSELRMVRGGLEPALASAVLARLEEVHPDTREVFGVFSNPFGEFHVVAVGSPLEAHEDLRYHTIVRGRSLMDGSRTLSEAAAALRRYAEQLEAAERAGWQLLSPIVNDHGFPDRPRPDQE